MRGVGLLMFFLVLTIAFEASGGDLKEVSDSVAQALGEKKTISAAKASLLFKEFDADRGNIELKIKTLPLLMRVDKDAFLKLARQYVMDTDQSFALKEAFLKVLMAELTKTPTVDSQLDAYVSKLLEDAMRRGWRTKAGFRKFNQYQGIQEEFRAYLRKHPHVSNDEFREFRDNLLLPRIERWKKAFIRNHSVDIGGDIISISSMPGGVSSILMNQEYLLALLELLSHKDDGVSMAAALELRSNTDQNFGFNPVGSKEEKDEAIKKWSDFLHAHDVFKERRELKKKKYFEMREKRGRKHEN